MTVQMYEKMCTPYSGAPVRHSGKGCLSKPDNLCSLDAELCDRLRTEATQVWNTDAGADELLAGREAKVRGPSSQDVQSVLPALRLVNRDRAHGSRRVVKRPWSADPYLRQVHEELVLKKTSMARIITYSPAIKLWYQEFQGESDDKVVATQKDVGFAPHRFDSSARPLAKVCLTFESLNMTAVKVRADRGSDAVGKHAVAHLEYVSDDSGVEVMVQAGMLADAADEGLILTRLNDEEGADTAGLMPVVKNYVTRMKARFVPSFNL